MFVGATGFSTSNIALVLYGDVPLDLSLKQEVSPCSVSIHDWKRTLTFQPFGFGQERWGRRGRGRGGWVAGLDLLYGNLALGLSLKQEVNPRSASMHGWWYTARPWPVQLEYGQSRVVCRWEQGGEEAAKQVPFRCLCCLPPA